MLAAVRIVRDFLAICAASALATAAPAQASAPAGEQLQTLLLASAEPELGTYFAYHGALWTRPDGSLDPAAGALLGLIETAELDGLDPTSLGYGDLAAAIRRADAERSPEALAEAELLLTRAFVAYVGALRQSGTGLIVYEHAALQPHAREAYFILREAAEAPSLVEYVRTMGWMHPLYGELRRALANEPQLSPVVLHAAIGNLARLREIPADPGERYVLVDVADARLWMYENGKPVDSMRVVVGKPETPTPAYAGYIRYAIANPYWNVPANLAQDSIAGRVINQGLAYLKRQRYEVVTNWGEGAELVDPASVDWRAVRRGESPVYLRQLPSSINAMGKVKYEFPNQFGIYLHDTPDKALLAKEARFFSNGCIRLEDADRLGRWLLGTSPEADSDRPEQRLDLPTPVPVYITYLTARAEDGRVALRPDPYAWDASPTALVHAD